MRVLLPLWTSLLAVFVSAVALARGPYDKGVIRTEKISDHPAHPTSTVYVSGQVATVLRFERDIAPAKTQLLGWEGRFEPLLVGSKMVVIMPIRDLSRDEAVPLLVTLVDGTEIPFIVKPQSFEEWGWTDHQVNVFMDHESYNAVLSELYDTLKKERALKEENQRFKKEENSIDHAYATLLANGQAKKTPFRREKSWRSKNEDMDILVEIFSGPEKAAVLVHLSNTYYGDSGEPWKFDGAYVTRDYTSFTTRPFALRLERSTIAPGQSGKIAVVVDKSAFETKDGDMTDLALQIFRGDGLLQVAVTLEASLIRH
ncbi:DUF2381 family protein [Hyalangium versicolor]|uniref:DUF2381 family protein n=1 Tax=Hyalangium versicolor TaxID=2861190 RepID=UPI001CCF5042|nr:DUF2381 family protein [Hyalangium versicolor]